MTCSHLITMAGGEEEEQEQAESGVVVLTTEHYGVRQEEPVPVVHF